MWLRAGRSGVRTPVRARDFSVCDGRDSSVGIATHYGLDGPGIDGLIQIGPGVHAASCTMDTPTG